MAKKLVAVHLMIRALSKAEIIAKSRRNELIKRFTAWSKKLPAFDYLFNSQAEGLRNIMSASSLWTCSRANRKQLEKAAKAWDKVALRGVLGS